MRKDQEKTSFERYQVVNTSRLFSSCKVPYTSGVAWGGAEGLQPHPRSRAS